MKMEIKSAINNNYYDGSDYFQWILHEGYQQHLLDYVMIENIQYQLFNLMATQTNKFTQGDSSSIPVDTAQTLLNSLCFTISFKLNNYSLESCCALLKEMSLPELFKQGQDLLNITFEDAKSLLFQAKNNAISTKNRAYNDTLFKGIDPFFQKYDMKFYAQDIPVSIDYPLSNNNSKLLGVEYVYNYILSFYLENKFCNSFTQKSINNLLYSYDEGYEELLVNIFQIVLFNALGCILIDKDPSKLVITEIDLDKIVNCKIDLSNSMLLYKTTQQLMEYLNIQDKLLRDYVYNSINQLENSITDALISKKPEKIFVKNKDKPPVEITIYKDRSKMPDEIFRKVEEEIRNCRHLSDKLQIISQLDSLGDLIDVFESHCINDNEIKHVFKLLDTNELSLLLSMSCVVLWESAYDFCEAEKPWEKTLLTYIKNLPKDEQFLIFKKAKSAIID